MANPSAKPDPDIPIKCFAEILEAISDAPIAHQVSEPSARKKSFESVLADFFLLINIISVGRNSDEINKEYNVVRSGQSVHGAIS